MIPAFAAQLQVAEESVDRMVTSAAVENTRENVSGGQDHGSEQDELLPQGQ